MDLFSMFLLLIFTVAVGWVTVMVIFKKAVDEDTKNESQSDHNGVTKGKKQQSNQISEGKKSSKQKSKGVQQVQSKEKFAHAWLISSLKGHSGTILGLDLSSNNKFMASCADDRTVYVWITKSFEDHDHKSIRVNIPFDHATFVRWSPDCKAFIIARQEEKMLEVYKLGRKADNSIGNITSALQWPEESASDYIGLGIACNGKFIMSYTKNGYIQLREPKGHIIKKFQTNLSETIEARVSPCGRFIAVVGTKEVEMYEVQFNVSSGSVQDVPLKWTIKPKMSGELTSAAFSTDSAKIVILGNNGTWQIFDTTGSRVNIETNGCVDEKTDGLSKPVVAISGDARVVGVGANRSIYLFSAFSGNQLGKISNIYKDAITCIEFTADNKYVITAGDSVIHVFKNICWCTETVIRLKSQLQDANVTGSMRKRLTSELLMFEEELKNV